LVLNGVGGRTVEEAQRNMSHAEFLSWVRFRNKRGSLFTGRRIEQMIASWMALYANAHSKNGGYNMFDFALHEEEPEWTLDRAMKEW
jgi:hypothetical protein